jgi:hypothetical protein
MSDDESRTVGEARWTLAKECMARLGFDSLNNLDTDPAPAWPQRPSNTGVLMAITYSLDDFRYGIQDPGQAARYGYRAVEAEYKRRYPEKKKWTLSEHLALTGQFVEDDPKTVHGHRIPEHGCLGEANRTIYGTNPQDRKDPVLELKTKSLEQGMRDPAWTKADKAWSVCMRKAGYRYATPKDAETEPRPLGAGRTADGSAVRPHRAVRPGEEDRGRRCPLQAADRLCPHRARRRRTRPEPARRQEPDEAGGTAPLEPRRGPQGPRHPRGPVVKTTPAATALAGVPVTTARRAKRAGEPGGVAVSFSR